MDAAEGYCGRCHDWTRDRGRPDWVLGTDPPDA
jgi:hypothetical protein